MPKFHLIYLKNIFDLCIIKFFDMYNDDFKKIDEKYVLSKDISKSKLLNVFKKLITEELKNLIVKYDRIHPDYFIIIGSCLPKDNLLLKYKDEKYFPVKLIKLLNSPYNIKYLLKEKDIVIDIMRFNDMCISLSNEMLKLDFFTKIFGNEYCNIMFIQHNKIDCYTLFKIIKHIYGKVNCINIYEQQMKNISLPLIAVNEIIRKYVNKTLMNRSDDMKLIQDEIRQYIDERLKNI